MDQAYKSTINELLKKNERCNVSHVHLVLYEDFAAEIFLFTCLFYANDDDCITLLSSSFVDKEIEDDVDKMEFDEIVIGSNVLGTRFVDDDKIDWELFIISFIFLYILPLRELWR
jgi:hypothetical protein